SPSSTATTSRRTTVGNFASIASSTPRSSTTTSCDPLGVPRRYAPCVTFAPPFLAPALSLGCSTTAGAPPNPRATVVEEVSHKVLGVLVSPPSPESVPNKGFEGIAFLPAALASDKRDHLVAIHQAKPKALVVVAWPSLVPEASVVIERAPPTDGLDRVLKD